jgi:uncharacterized protein
MDERRIRVETGYGIESVLPDGKVGEIMDRYMVPFLRRSQFGKALYNGTAAFADVVARDAGVQLDFGGQRTGPVEVEKEGGAGRLFPILLLVFIVIGVLGRGRGLSFLFLLPWLFLGGPGSRGTGGGFGGFSGGFGGFGGGMSGGGGATRGF